MGNTPAQNPYVINDLFAGVQEILYAKTTVTPEQSAIWCKKALINITAKYTFEELRVKGPLVTIGPGLGNQGSNYEYPISMFLNNADDYTLMDDPVIFLSQQAATQVNLVGTGSISSSTVGYPMDYMTVKAIQPLLFIPGGIPFKYTRHGKYFWFGTQPGQNYQVYLPYQIKHPFMESNLPQTPLKIPTDWNEIIEYSAALRGAQANRWPDMIEQLKTILYGDPNNPKGRPGLLTAIDLQIERDQRNSTRQILPVVSRY